jgi:hypothetical protein
MSDDTPKLRKSLLGKVRSDEGWSVKITGPLSIVYSDVLGDVRVGGEARAGGSASSSTPSRSTRFHEIALTSWSDASMKRSGSPDGTYE